MNDNLEYALFLGANKCSQPAFIAKFKFSTLLGENFFFP